MQGIQSNQVSFLETVADEYKEILTPEAIEFLVELHTNFDGRRRERLAVSVLAHPRDSTRL